MVENSLNQFQHDDFTVIQTNKPDCKIQLEVTLTPKKSEQCYQQAIKMVRREVSIPGFRKGKAPLEMIEEKYSREIAKEFQREVTEVLNDACKLVGKFPIHEGTLSISSISAKRDGNSSFVANYETFPAVPLISPETFKLQLFVQEPTTEEEVQNTIKNLCYEHGEWTPVEDRPSQEGDFVTVDVEQKRGDEWINVSENVHLHLDRAKEQPWILNALTGVSLDEFVEATRPLQQEGAEEDLPLEEGDINYRFHVTHMRTCKPLDPEQLPEKLKLTDYASTDKKIREELEKFAEMELKDKQRDLVYEYLKESIPFDLPTLLIDVELAHRKERLKEKAQKENGDPQSIEKFFLDNKEEYRKSLASTLRAEFLLKEFIHQRGVNPTEIEMRDLAQKMMRDMDSLMEMMQNPDKFSERLKNEATRCKALDMIYQEATGSSKV